MFRHQRHAMRKLKSRFKAFYHDEEAASAVEYGIIAVLIATALVAILRQMGTKVGSTISSVQGGLP
jgi:Flp pilus assembly pilin Flp